MDPPIENPRKAAWLEMEDKLRAAQQRIAELEAENDDLGGLVESWAEDAKIATDELERLRDWMRNQHTSNDQNPAESCCFCRYCLQVASIDATLKKLG